MNAEQVTFSIDEFKSCLMDSSQAQFSLQEEKYLELSAQKRDQLSFGILKAVGLSKLR